MKNSIKNERSSIEEDIYAKELIKKVKEIETGLNYYIKHSQQLENELNLYKIMYENRVEEYLKLKQQIKESQKENEELEEINNELEAEKNDAIRRYNFETIPIKKVKDKIKELKNISNAEELEDIMNRKNYTIAELVQYVLQELLEGRKI